MRNLVHTTKVEHLHNSLLCAYLLFQFAIGINRAPHFMHLNHF